jgi:tetratricopeptide (TPR) repeat protein
MRFEDRSARRTSGPSLANGRKPRLRSASHAWVAVTFVMLSASLVKAQDVPVLPPDDPVVRLAALSSPVSTTPPLFDFSDLKGLLGAAPPNQAEQHLEEARKLGKSGDASKAIEEASLAIWLSPGFVEAYRFRAEMYQSKQLYRRQIADLSEIIRLVPSSWIAFLERGFASCLDRDFEHGFADFETALKLSTTASDRATIHHWRGCAQVFRGEYALAIAEFEQAIELGSNASRIFEDLGRALAMVGDHDRAIAEFDRSLAIATSANSLYYRAESRLARGEFALAQADYERAIETNPNEAWSHQGRGWSRLALGQVDGAIEDFNRSLKLTPKASIPLASRGWAYLAKRDVDRAVKDFEEAIASQQAGYVGFGFAFAKCVVSTPAFDHAVDEFYRQSQNVHGENWALIRFHGDEGRSWSSPYPFFEMDLVGRNRADSQIAPNWIFYLVSAWRPCPEAKLAELGQAMTSVRRSKWDEAVANLGSAARAWLEGHVPDLMRPTNFWEFLGQN